MSYRKSRSSIVAAAVSAATLGCGDWYSDEPVLSATYYTAGTVTLELVGLSSDSPDAPESVEAGGPSTAEQRLYTLSYAGADERPWLSLRFELSAEPAGTWCVGEAIKLYCEDAECEFAAESDDWREAHLPFLPSWQDELVGFAEFGWAEFPSKRGGEGVCSLESARVDWKFDPASKDEQWNTSPGD